MSNLVLHKISQCDRLGLRDYFSGDLMQMILADFFMQFFLWRIFHENLKL